MNIIKKIFGQQDIIKKNLDLNKLWNKRWFYSVFSPESLNSLSYLKLYKGWVYSAITKVSEATSGLPLQVLDRNSRRTVSKDISLITHILIENIVSYLKLTWTAYVRKIKLGGMVTRLEVLRTDLVTIRYEEDKRTPKSFLYSLKWAQESFLPNEILIITDFNPSLPDKWNVKWYWVLNSIIEQLGIEWSILQWNRDFFDNDGTPWMIISSDDDVTPEQQKKYIKSWKQNYAWKGNKHKIAFIDKGLKLSNLWPVQKEVDFVEQRKFAKDEILSAFGVPQALLWLASGVNVWNVKAFEEIFYKNTIFPLCRKIEEALNIDTDLFKKCEFKFVKDFVLDMDELRADYLAGLLTLNEIRAKKWYPDIADGDKVFTNPKETEEVIEKKENEKVPDWKRKDEK